MRLFGHGGCSPIGIDLGSRCAKAVQLSRRRGGSRGPHGNWRVESALVLELPAGSGQWDAAAVARLAEVLRRRGFAGSQVVLGALGRQLTLETLELPPRASGAPIEQLARAELARTTKLAIGSFEMACWDVPGPVRSSPATHLMAAALPHADADACLDAFAGQDYQVAALDVPACALARVCAGESAGDRALAVLDVGWSAATLVLVQQDVVIYQRRLSEGAVSALHGRLMNDLRLDAAATELLLRSDAADPVLPDAAMVLAGPVSHFAETLAEELKLSLGYLSQRHPQLLPNHLRLVGGGACLVGIDTALSRRLSFPVTLLTPTQRAECPSTLQRASSPILTTALGLALYGEG